MVWTIEYYEQRDGTQPAEVFEDELDRTHVQLGAKLARIAEALKMSGPQLGGGLIESCRGYSGLWEMRAIFGQTLARELFGFDGSRVVLLHGYVKRGGDPASAKDLNGAAAYWQNYLSTRRISPEEPEQPESSETERPAKGAKQ